VFQTVNVSTFVNGQERHTIWLGSLRIIPWHSYMHWCPFNNTATISYCWLEHQLHQVSCYPSSIFISRQSITSYAPKLKHATSASHSVFFHYSSERHYTKRESLTINGRY